MTLDEFAYQIPVEKTGENDFSAKVRFPEELSVFSGHFPGNPILPGVAYLFVAEKLAARVLGEKIVLRQLKRTKFFQPSRPGDPLEIAGRLENDPGDKNILRAQVLFSGEDGRKVCSVKMILEKEK